MAIKAAIYLSCAFVATALTAEKSFAWGKVGHEAVAVIAEQNLDDNVRAKISKFLQGDSMAEAATWPDKVKHTGSWQHTSPYHFADMDDSQSYMDMIDALPAKSKGTGDVIRALVKAEDVLRDGSSSADQKKYALSFMIHLIGDLHQPLHEGRPDDRGGNDIDATYFGVKTNLHSVWDTYIIENILKNLMPIGLGATLKAVNGAKPAKDDTANFVDQLRTPTRREVAQWQNSYLLDWSNDSIEKRTDIYSNWKGSNGAAYQKKYADYVNERVLRAGYRLAAWLNAIVDGDDFQAEKSAEIRQHFAENLGSNYSDAIVLEPSTKGLEMTATELHVDDCHDD